MTRQPKNKRTTISDLSDTPKNLTTQEAQRVKGGTDIAVSDDGGAQWPPKTPVKPKK
ncbi:MAG: hypothetical protein U0Y68_03320 [Blastocatellia bacterium]